MSFSILPGAPRWDVNDSATLREFLVKPVGQRLLQLLFYRRPSVSARDASERMMQHDNRDGWEQCLSELLEAARPEAVSAEDREVSAATIARENTQR